MAEQGDIDRVKRLTDGAEGYTDAQISAALDAGEDVRSLTHRIWQEKAATYASLVNVSESGSTRAMGDLYKNALAMSEKFKSEDATVVGGAVKRTRAAVRE